MALKSQLGDLKAELEEYEALRTGQRHVLELDSFEDLPRALVQARIAAGLNQQDLAAKLGIKGTAGPALRSERLSVCELGASW